MSLNTQNIGDSIAIIKDNKKYKNTIFSVCEDKEKELKNTFDNFEIKEGVFQVIPNVNNDRQTIFLAGTSGSGKSYWISKYCIEYHKLYSKNPIYFISEQLLLEDKAFEGQKYISQINIDDDILEDPLNYRDFEDCLVIFDDTDALTGIKRKYRCFT